MGGDELAGSVSGGFYMRDMRCINTCLCNLSHNLHFKIVSVKQPFSFMEFVQGFMGLSFTWMFDFVLKWPKVLFHQS